MSRSVYRETDVREYEEAPRRTYTTVKRYQVPEPSGGRSSLGSGDAETKEKVVIRTQKSAQPLRTEEDYRFSDRRSEVRARDDVDIRITERTREREAPRQQEDDYRFTERVIEREREPVKRDVTYRVVERDREVDYDDRRSSVRGDYRSDYRADFRVERDRENVRAPSPPTQEKVREYRFERERDFSPQYRRERDDTFEVERYSKDTEYYSPAPQPQPIIIRERAAQPIIIRERDPAPIIIREERREPQYEFIERREVEEDKQLVRREEPPPSPDPTVRTSKSVTTVAQQQPQPQEEDYFYERRIREVAREPRRRSDSYERRTEIRPRDSASNYSSDDSYEYVRKERTYEDDRDSHHKRHLAEGALAGVVGAQILRKHREAEGKDGGGRVKSALGGAALGAVAAEGISRYRSRSRRRDSRSRSRSSSYDSRRTRRTHRGRRDRDHSRSRSRSRSRSKSLSRKQLAGLAGVAAVGALAGYALKNKNKNETVIVKGGSPPGRSRSRRRRGSYDSYMDEQVREEDKHRDPSHRNRRIAQVGLGTAAAAGLFERFRSKSRGGKSRERSKSRVRTGVPIAAAGLGGAALAGLYEKNKASKEAKRDAIIQDELGRGRRRRSRSRSRSVPAPYPDSRRGSNDHGLIAYGDEPIHPADRGYDSDEEGAAVYRRRGGSRGSSVSPDNRRRSRSHSRRRHFAEGAGAAALGAAGTAAYERHQRDRQNRDRQRYEDEQYYNNYGNSPNPYGEPPSGFLPPEQQNAGYGPQNNYPSSTYFPPPPTAPVENAYAHGHAYPDPQQPYPPYNPADYLPAATPANAQQTYPYEATRGAYGESDANLGAPYGGETYAGDNRYPPPNPAAEEQAAHEEHQRGRDPNNVSAPPPNSSAAFNNNNIGNNNERDVTQNADGVAAPRARSTSRVRFDLDANTAHSPELSRKAPVQERYSDSETSGDRKRRPRSTRHGEGGSGRHHRDRSGDRERQRGSTGLMHDQYDRPPTGSGKRRDRRGRERDEDEESEGTIELPPRFDEHGNRKPEGGDALETLLGSLAGRFFGGGSDTDDGGPRRRTTRH